MGRTMASLTIGAALSSHNSEEDERDAALWEDLRERAAELCREEKYRPIMPDVY